MSAPVGLDCVYVTEHQSTREGLMLMFEAAIGPNGYELLWADPQLVLLLIEACKRAEDRPEWFPKGKWATIQQLQMRVDEQLARMFVIAPGEAVK